MNISKTIKTATFGLIILGLSGSPPVFAGHRSATPAPEATGPGLIYTDTALGQAIFGYLNLQGAERAAANPQIVYVNQAYGQAIYSYPRVAPDTVTAFNVTFVNQAYGPAIFSYPGLDDDAKGSVEVLPLLPD